MCCCRTARVNGENGYSWDGKTFGVYPVHLPEMEEGDELIRDLPGRCGGIDSHSHDFRVVVQRWGRLFLLVNHGGGSERIRLSGFGGVVDTFKNLSEREAYWLALTIYDAHSDARSQAKDETTAKWQRAAAEKRIKTRKQRNSNAVKVWIEPKQAIYA